MISVTNPLVVGGAFSVALFFLILVALRMGRRLGLKAMQRYGAENVSAVSSLETAVFALLGLLIAFSFSGALQRFDTRRVQAVDEANAVGTAWYRIDLLPPSEQPRLREKMRQYVDSRIATYTALPDIARAQAEVARSQRMQGEIWALAVAAVRAPDARPNADLMFLPALNQMFDLTTVRLAASQIHPPTIIYAMLFGLAIAAALLAGYQTAPQKGYDWMQKVGFAFIVSLTVYVILDIEYPRLGFVDIEHIDAFLVSQRASMN